MIVEQLERRVLGAVRFVDATTGARVSVPLAVSVSTGTVIRNRQGDYVIRSAPGFAQYEDSFFEPPASPAVGSIVVVIRAQDPTGQYLPRRQTLALPREPEPALSDRADSLFQPIRVTVYRSPVARTGRAWAVIRATTVARDGGGPIRNALIRVLRTTDDALLSSGLSDERGEALVAVAGIPITTWGEGEGAVLSTSVDVMLEVLVDPENRDLADPDDMVARRQSLPSSRTAAQLSSGRELVRVLTVP